MSEYGELVNATTLRFERTLPGTLEEIWDYLVDDEKRGQWFAGGKTDLRVGGIMQFVFKNSQLSNPPDPTPEKYKEFGYGFISEAIIKEIEAPRLLVVEWEGLVTFELEEIGDQVRLTLTHEKMKDDQETRVGTLAGWHTHLNIMEDLSHKRSPDGFWKVHMNLEGKYGERLS